MIVPRPADVDRFLQGIGRDALIDLLWRAAVELVDVTVPDVESAALAVIVRLVKERGGHGGGK